MCLPSSKVIYHVVVFLQLQQLCVLYNRSPFSTGRVPRLVIYSAATYVTTNNYLFYFVHPYEVNTILPLLFVQVGERNHCHFRNEIASSETGTFTNAHGDTFTGTAISRRVPAKLAGYPFSTQDNGSGS